MTRKPLSGFSSLPGRSLPGLAAHNTPWGFAIKVAKACPRMMAKRFAGSEKPPNWGWQLPSAISLVVTAWEEECPRILKQQLVGMQRRQSKDKQMPNTILLRTAQRLHRELKRRVLLNVRF